LVIWVEIVAEEDGREDLAEAVEMRDSQKRFGPEMETVSRGRATAN
jgi:hypothetical protein